MSFCVIAQFKNEAHVISEWLQHYRDEGCSRFYLIDNASTDSYSSLPCMQSPDIVLSIKPGVHMQEAYYNDVFQAYREEMCQYDFVAVVDLDEFLFHPTTSISSYLDSMPKSVSQVLIQWSMFGSSGYFQQPASIFDFTWRKQGLSPLTKALVRPKCIAKLKIHSHVTCEGENVYDTVLQLNHYAIQSYSFFSRIKMTRGSANNAVFDKVRNEEYFLLYDFKDYEDLQLQNKRKTFKLEQPQ